MKTIAILLLMLPLCCFSQKIVRDEVDEFTKTKIKETSWEPGVRDMKIYTFFRVRVLDNDIILGLKFMQTNRDKILSIYQDDPLMLLLKNDTVVTLKCLKSVVSCKGCGAKGFSGSSAYGINASYYVDLESLELLKQFPIKKMRIYTTDGYIPVEFNDENGTVVKELLRLVE